MPRPSFKYLRPALCCRSFAYLSSIRPSPDATGKTHSNRPSDGYHGDTNPLFHRLNKMVDSFREIA